MFQAVFACVSSYLCTRSGVASPKGLVHNLLMQFVTLGSSKIRVFETFFWILPLLKMTIQGL